MNLKQDILYLKIERNTVIHKPEVVLSDVGKLQLQLHEGPETGGHTTKTGNHPVQKQMLARLQQMKLHRFPAPEKRKPRQACAMSVLLVIQKIQQEFPNLLVINMGETDFVIHYVSREASWLIQTLKTAFVCFALFFGGAVTIMIFNRESNIMQVFDILYHQVTGRAADGLTILDVSYCIGLPLGILLFYNHIGRKKLTDDPTPVQVSMRKYEEDVDTTYIESSSREGKALDVE